jgi:hypothetical protein
MRKVVSLCFRSGHHADRPGSSSFLPQTLPRRPDLPLRPGSRGSPLEPQEKRRIRRRTRGGGASGTPIRFCGAPAHAGRLQSVPCVCGTGSGSAGPRHCQLCQDVFCRLHAVVNLIINLWKSKYVAPSCRQCSMKKTTSLDLALLHVYNVLCTFLSKCTLVL